MDLCGLPAVPQLACFEKEACRGRRYPRRGAFRRPLLKFRLADEVHSDEFSPEEKEYLRRLADDIAGVPAEADGNWFHQAIYAYKESGLLPPRELFTTIYRVLIGKDSGPRAGWFLSILPRDWLVERLRLMK